MIAQRAQSEPALEPLPTPEPAPSGFTALEGLRLRGPELDGKMEVVGTLPGGKELALITGHVIGYLHPHTVDDWKSVEALDAEIRGEQDRLARITTQKLSLAEASGSLEDIPMPNALLPEDHPASGSDTCEVLDFVAPEDRALDPLPIYPDANGYAGDTVDDLTPPFPITLFSDEAPDLFPPEPDPVTIPNPGVTFIPADVTFIPASGTGEPSPPIQFTPPQPTLVEEVEAIEHMLLYVHTDPGSPSEWNKDKALRMLASLRTRIRAENESGPFSKLP